ncbi:MAG: hypothetical protein HZB34_12890 [Nitrospirae bacterium]|nr:hypothetical protein [Nitrospirota bacterium]
MFVVGVASKARTVEQGRRQAFEQGKVELMNFAQITNLEAQGLVIETQMTFEEPNADGTVTVYRLLRVPASKLVAIQGRLQAQSRAQEQAIEESRKELAVIQQTLGEKATKLDQQQRQVEHVLQQINKTIQSTGTSTNRSEGSVSLVDRLKEADAKLDANEQEVSRLSRQVQERVMSRSLKACQYITPGMNQSEVGKLLGPSDGVSRKVIQEEGNWDSVDTWGYGNSVVIFTTRKVVSGVLGCTR